MKAKDNRFSVLGTANAAGCSGRAENRVAAGIGSGPELREKKSRRVPAGSQGDERDLCLFRWEDWLGRDQF